MKKPLLKKDDGFEGITFEEAKKILEKRLESEDFGVFIDSSLTCEEIDLIVEKFKTEDVASDAFSYQEFLKNIDGSLEVCSLEEAFDCDVLLVVGDFWEELSPVMGTLLRLKVIQDRKRIIRVGQFSSKLDSASYKVFVGNDISGILTSERLLKLLRRKRFSLIVGGNLYDLPEANEVAEVISDVFGGNKIYPAPLEVNAYYLCKKNLFFQRNLSSSVNVYFVASNEKFAFWESGRFKILFTPFFDEFAESADLIILIETFLEKGGKVYLPVDREKVLKKAVECEVSLRFLKDMSDFKSESNLLTKKREILISF